MKLAKIFTLYLFALCASSVYAQNIVIKIGCIAPANSPWDIGLKKLASEWSRISGGKVKLVFPKSVANVSNQDMVQKLKLSLDGAVLDTTGLALLDNDINFLSMPSVIRDDVEYDKVMAVAIPLIQKKLSDRYELLSVGKGGWIYLFSNSIIKTPEDLKKTRFAVGRSMDSLNKLLQAMGVRTVPTDRDAELLQLNSGSIDTIYSSPIYLAAMWAQYKRVITNMAPVRLSPFFGGVVINRRVWDSIPESMKPALKAATEKIVQDISLEAIKLDNEAIDALKKGGLNIPPYNAADAKEWHKLYEEKLRTTIIDWYTPSFTAAVLKAVSR